ncbi:SpoIID/LytB domain protein [Caldalkalibacillus thermarum TA2.A1]|uniref:SpoIID/LytB domain protein n=1 Tax=Caldalkalibacillus thermarum (strain TA2.A1) TaxID=986075 RepID=F5L998_CALTT|nr:SpoIID/LytB domain-containing protein [Caldalkalibacillus thermarum]EGL82040.1 SpoIID/LytB domain protein [Caldalkalibacillus thermarum TA2.A1]QZT34041.1 SpoIID/LytB domain-containing protein [Caldalkalibacillus thermarum TA2.A1]
MRFKAIMYAALTFILLSSFYFGSGHVVLASVDQDDLPYSQIKETYNIIFDGGTWYLIGREGYITIKLEKSSEKVEVIVHKDGPLLVSNDPNVSIVTEDVSANYIIYLIHPEREYNKEFNLIFYAVPSETEDYSIKAINIRDTAQDFNMMSTQQSDTVTIRGGGFGHRVGMSQWGAQGLARSGVSYDKILSHYYPGTRLEQRYNDSSQQVTVSLNNGNSRQEWIVKAPNGANIIDSTGKPAGQLDSNVTYRLSSEGQSLKFEKLNSNGTVASTQTVTGTSVNLNPGNSVIEINFSSNDIRKYTGTLKAEIDKGIKLTNIVNLDNYLNGVVPYEAYASWNIEALKAQTVAARTFAASRSFNVRDTQSDQVYRGVYEGQYANNVRSAVQGTNGQVLIFNGSLASSVYSASNGGWIESNVHGFGSSTQFAYLQGREDVYGSSKIIPEQKTTDNGPHSLSLYRWERYVTKSAIESAWPSIGQFQAYQITERAAGRGAETIKITGSKGTVSVNGREFRSKLGLPSTLIEPDLITFPDVSEKNPEYAIYALVREGIITGYPDGTFRPNGNITREEFGAILFRILGLKEKPEAAEHFVDVPRNSWAKGIIGALVDAGITRGVSADRFGYGENLTREQMASFFIRVLGYQKESEAANLPLTYSDANQIRQVHRNDVAFATEIGLMAGTGYNRFSPQEFSQRQWVARVAYEVYFNADQYHQRASQLGN